MALDAQVQQTIRDIVHRIVSIAQPEKIVLFGSAARGTQGHGSDLDLLVVKSGVHRRRLAQTIYLSLHGIEKGVDIVVVTPEDIDRYRDCPWLVIGPALREGIVVYDRAATA